MTDLSMHYLGMKLSGPIVVASTPLSESIDNIRHMEDAGASAIVLTSLFEEQLALESRALESTARFANRQHVRLGITDRPAHFYKAADTAASNATRSRFPAGRQEKRQSIFRPQLLLHFSPG